jgi:hypothetical protein
MKSMCFGAYFIARDLIFSFALYMTSTLYLLYTEIILARLSLLYFPCALYQTHLRVCLSNK